MPSFQPLNSLVALLVGCWLLWPAAGVASELTRTQQQLKEIEQRIESTTASLAQGKQRERELIADLEKVEETRRRLEARLAELSRDLSRLENEIRQEERRAEALRASLDALEGQVEKRLVAIYKAGDGGLLRVLFGAESPARLAEDYDFLGRIVRRDRELMARYRAQLQQRREALEKLAGLQRRQQATLAASDKERQTLRQAEQVKSRLLGALRQEQAELSRQLAVLRERAARLADLLKGLESKKRPEYTEKTGLFSRQKGRLQWPMAGEVTVPFGTSRHPELGTLHESQGIEIACEPGRPVRAVWGGRVAFANQFKGYGNLLILDHGDSFYSLYAQVTRLEKQVGDSVSQGEVVATSGYEGNPHLYFEIRQSGRPLDPEDWLAPR